MNFNFGGRMMAAFGLVPGSLVGLGVDAVSPLRVEVMSGDSGTFDEVTLYRSESEQYRFAFAPLSEAGGILASPPLLSLRREKRLVITQIDNSDIEVVERYGTEPYEISWRGLLIDMDEHRFPIEQLAQMNELFEVNGEWNVSSEILNRVGVDALYIKDIAFDTVEGFEDTIAYTMTARAIRPLEYQLLNG